MPNVNPILHLDDEFMWRWSQVDERGKTAFLSTKPFFFREECRQDYDRVMQRLSQTSSS